LMCAITTVTLRRTVFFFTLVGLTCLATVSRTPNLDYLNGVLFCRKADDYRRSLTPFLPATVFLGPLRVRAFVLVR
jgi:hypothetical protein